MLYAGSPTLGGLGYVVMDEVHYLSDRFRGAVWEEVIIHLPERCSWSSLSATVSNAEEFGDWLDTVRGDTAVVVEEHRPVPLWQHVMVGDRLYDLFDDDDQQVVNPRARPARARRGPLDASRPRAGQPSAAARSGRAPTAHRVCSRRASTSSTGSTPRGCCPPSRSSSAAPAATPPSQQCLRAGLRLNDAGRAAAGPRDRRGALRRHPRRGPARPRLLRVARRPGARHRRHHAGMLPTFKEVVEELFVRGLVKAVFATETLALGINMPARSVVLEKLVKWNGETARRRHAGRVHPADRPRRAPRHRRRGPRRRAVAAPGSTRGRSPGSRRPAPIRCAPASARRTTWRSTSSASSAATPRARAAGDVVRAVPGRPRRRRARPAGAAQRGGARGLPRGDDLPPRRLRGVRGAAPRPQGPRDRPRPAGRRQRARRPRVVAGEAAPGDVIRVPAGRRAGLAVVARPGQSPARARRAAADRAHRRPAGQAARRRRLPGAGRGRSSGCGSRKSFNPRTRSPAATSRPRCAPRAATTCRERSRDARSQAADDREIARLRAAIRQHPCHGCDEREDHARWAERYHRLQRDTQALERRDRRPHEHDRPHLRPRLRAAARAGLPRRRRGHRRRAAGWRGSTASSTCWPPSACAPGVWDGLDAGRAGRVRLGAGLRVAPVRRRGAAEAAGRRGARGAAATIHLWNRAGDTREGHRAVLPARIGVQDVLAVHQER